MTPYVEAFQKAAQVVVRNAAEEAIEEIRGNVENAQYSCLVLDVMMPPPKDWEARTQDGLFTGVEILKECQDEIIAVELPVLILTNQKLEEVNAKVESLKFPDELVKVHAKLLTRPFYATNVVVDLVKKWKKE